MCSLFGWLDYQGIMPHRMLRKLTQALANAAEERGTDAAGISYVRNGEVVIYKRPKPAHKRKPFPHGNRSTAILVGFMTVTVLYGIIELRSSVIVTESCKKASPALMDYTAEVITGIYHISELVYELSGVSAYTAIKVYKITVGIVENLKFLRCFMKKHSACTAENFYIPPIVKRKTYYYLVSERFLTSHP